MPEQDFRDDPSTRGPLRGPGPRRGPDTPGAAGTDGTTGTGEATGAPGDSETEAERRRRRARFLRELAEARALRDRVQPRRAKAARLRHAMRMRTFRW
ncbi:hypothetical protein [Streptomyces sp. NPDC052012]|uniref:hypothetical protein n=1 Tax=Streptomyces sp. NPDC052012 TaxID=3155051 RepID=UPI00344FB6DD